jgi:hypothetical protein
MDSRTNTPVLPVVTALAWSFSTLTCSLFDLRSVPSWSGKAHIGAVRTYVCMTGGSTLVVRSRHAERRRLAGVCARAWQHCSAGVPVLPRPRWAAAVSVTSRCQYSASNSTVYCHLPVCTSCVPCNHTGTRLTRMQHHTPPGTWCMDSYELAPSFVQDPFAMGTPSLSTAAVCCITHRRRDNHSAVMCTSYSC